MPTLLSILRDNYKMLKRQLGHPQFLGAAAALPVVVIGKKTRKSWPRPLARHVGGRRVVPI